MIKKRVFITIFFTCLSLFLLQDFWLIKKPIDVGFNFEGKNINSVELRLSKENSSDFEENPAGTRKRYPRGFPRRRAFKCTPLIARGGFTFPP